MKVRTTNVIKVTIDKLRPKNNPKINKQPKFTVNNKLFASINCYWLVIIVKISAHMTYFSTIISLKL